MDNRRTPLAVGYSSLLLIFGSEKICSVKSGVRHQARLPHFFVPSTWNNNRQPVKSKINMHNAHVFCLFLATPIKKQHGVFKSFAA